MAKIHYRGRNGGMRGGCVYVVVRKDNRHIMDAGLTRKTFWIHSFHETLPLAKYERKEWSLLQGEPESNFSIVQLNFGREFR